MARTISWREAAEGLQRDLDSILGPRLRALVVYEAHGILGDLPGAPVNGGEAEIHHADLVHTLALVDALALGDLNRLAPLTAGWEKQGLAVPLFLDSADLARSLDAFPLEFSQILSHHVLVAGDDPFHGLAVERDDLRRACETQVKSHLLHLREGYLQAGGDSRKVADLVVASAAPLRALLVNIARLRGANARSAEALLHFTEQHLPATAEGLRPIVLLGTRHGRLRGPETADAFPRYLEAVEQLARLVDEWTL